jgi:hypothetical protein
MEPLASRILSCQQEGPHGGAVAEPFAKAKGTQLSVVVALFSQTLPSPGSKWDEMGLG